jgi:hypothetical protein
MQWEGVGKERSGGGFEREFKNHIREVGEGSEVPNQQRRGKCLCGGEGHLQGNVDWALKSSSLMSDWVRDTIRTKESIETELSSVWEVVEVSPIAIAIFLPLLLTSSPPYQLVLE